MRPARAERWHPAILLGMEPHPPDRGPGRIIFLNDASSTGKSTLAKAMQETLAEPFLHVSSDHLVVSGMLPARRDREGPFAWWQQMRPRFFDGFHRCLPALAAAGNDLIVEHIIEFRTWREDLARMLEGLDVFLVGVHCDLAEIDRRERDRGDRRIGEGPESARGRQPPDRGSRYGQRSRTAAGAVTITPVRQALITTLAAILMEAPRWPNPTRAQRDQTVNRPSQSGTQLGQAGRQPG